MRPPRTLMAVAALFVLASPAGAETVRGVLWASRSAAERANADDTRRRSSDAVVARSQRGIGDAVVWIEQVPEKLERRLASGGRRWFWQKRSAETKLASVVQRGHLFAPRVLVVTVGSRVEFRNADHVYHNVFSVAAAKRFDLGKNAPGAADTIAFEKPGVVNLHCDIHPEELGFVVVVPNHFLARPDSLGAFTLPALTPGTYRLHAWHPRLGELKRSIDVPKHGDVGLQLVF